MCWELVPTSYLTNSSWLVLLHRYHKLLIHHYQIIMQLPFCILTWILIPSLSVSSLLHLIAFFFTLDYGSFENSQYFVKHVNVVFLWEILKIGTLYDLRYNTNHLPFPVIFSWIETSETHIFIAERVIQYVLGLLLVVFQFCLLAISG